jgi:four helix bundle protein
MRDFRKLIVWQKSHALAVEAHRALGGRPIPGAAASRSQLLRAIASVPANIAEGCGKRSEAEFARYLDIALGSVKESENHLLFARDMGWLSKACYALLDERLAEVRRMLFSLTKIMRGRIESAVNREAGEQGGRSVEQ